MAKISFQFKKLKEGHQIQITTSNYSNISTMREVLMSVFDTEFLQTQIEKEYKNTFVITFESKDGRLVEKFRRTVTRAFRETTGLPEINAN